MAEKIVVENGEWENKENRFKYCKELEAGNILFFSSPPFFFPREEIDFLLQQKQGNSRSRKNIAYKPQLDKVTNHDSLTEEQTAMLQKILRNYSKKVAEFLAVLLAPYAEHFKLDYASFRPFQEKGRKLRVRARNDLLHVDAFPTRPLRGDRILRFFTNINPTESRRWNTAGCFSDLLHQFIGSKGLPFPKVESHSFKDRLELKMKMFLQKMGFKIPIRSPYDRFMLKMHNFLKENSEFQETCLKTNWEFPPNSCWIVFTDQVSHAALSGQYALEQTVLVPQRALLYPESSPLGVLERLTDKTMV